MIANQTDCSKLEQRSVIKIFRADYVKFMDKCILCTGKYVFGKKKFSQKDKSWKRNILTLR